MPEAPTAPKPTFEKLRELAFEPTPCPVCGTDGEGRVLEKKVGGYHMKYTRCASCNTLYANPRATEESLKNIYASEDYYEGKENNINYYSYLDGEPHFSKTAAGRVKRIRKVTAGTDLLEAGCAAGFFLNQAKQAGFNVTGIDFSGPMAAYAAQRFGVPVTAGSVEHMDLPAAAYDVVAAWGIFTTLRDPAGVLQKFNRTLRPGGVLAFNTPYNEALWAKVMDNRWAYLWPNISQVHADRTLTRLLGENGFAVVKKKRDWPYTGLKYLVFFLLNNFGLKTKKGLYDRLGFLNSLLFRVPSPDVYEYICVKRKDV